MLMLLFFTPQENICRYVEYYEDPRIIYLILEVCSFPLTTFSYEAHFFELGDGGGNSTLMVGTC